MSPAGPKRVFICTNCDETFESAAKSVRNARHSCASGERGTGRPLGTDGKPEPSQYVRKQQEAQIEHIPGDATFEAVGADPSEAAEPEPEPEYDETPVSTYLPPEQETPETPPEATETAADAYMDPESQQKLAALVALFNAATSGETLSPEQEGYLMQEALSGLVGISLEEGQPFVIPAWVYSATVGAGLLAYKTGLLKPAVRPKQTTIVPPVDASGRKDTASERGGWAEDWGGD